MSRNSLHIHIVIYMTNRVIYVLNKNKIYKRTTTPIASNVIILNNIKSVEYDSQKYYHWPLQVNAIYVT